MLCNQKNCINCYIDLYGILRFKDDTDWSNLLSQMKDRVATITDIETITDN